LQPGQLTLFRLACVVCGAAVALGAFGAHGLKARLEPEMLAVFEVGVRYQFYHGLALLACSFAPGSLWKGPWLARAGAAWLAGIVIFSGSLYLLSVSGIRWLGAITPIGGVAFIAGWVMAIWGTRGLIAERGA
jgi:uncharacterized membrane protein YgdD (TMEM256/DUF423 family)